MSGAAALRTEWEPRVLSTVRIVAGLLYLQHGLSKFFNFPVPFPAGHPAMFTLYWFAGMIEVIGSLLLILGLFTRAAAFIMSGEMAVAYFYVHMPRGGFFPLANGGEPVILFCFLFFYFFVAGGGCWSLDQVLFRNSARR